MLSKSVKTPKGTPVKASKNGIAAGPGPKTAMLDKYRKQKGC